MATPGPSLLRNPYNAALNGELTPSKDPSLTDPVFADSSEFHDAWEPPNPKRRVP